MKKQIVMKFKFKYENREQKRNKEMFYARVEITVIIMYGRVPPTDLPSSGPAEMLEERRSSYQLHFLQ